MPFISHFSLLLLLLLPPPPLLLLLPPPLRRRRCCCYRRLHDGSGLARLSDARGHFDAAQQAWEQANYEPRAGAVHWSHAAPFHTAHSRDDLVQAVRTHRENEQSIYQLAGK